MDENKNELIDTETEVDEIEEEEEVTPEVVYKTPNWLTSVLVYGVMALIVGVILFCIIVVPYMQKFSVKTAISCLEDVFTEDEMVAIERVMTSYGAKTYGTSLEIGTFSNGDIVYLTCYPYGEEYEPLEVTFFNGAFPRGWYIYEWKWPSRYATYCSCSSEDCICTAMKVGGLTSSD